MHVDVAVIGGGPAGTAAALEAARAGVSVALLSEAIGGRAAHATTIPMRVLARAESGVSDLRAVREEALDRGRAFAERMALSLDDAGVTVFTSRARFASSHALGFEDTELSFDRAVIATGASARHLPGAPPDERRIFTTDSLLALTDVPNDALVIGGGSAGAEIADALARLSCRVTWIMDELGLLPSFDRELAEAVGDVSMERGMKLVHGKRVLELSLGEPGVLAKLDGGRTYAASIAVCAVGGAPSTEALDLARAGLALDARGAIRVDPSCRTSVPHLFAAGEVTALTDSVGGAEAMGRTAGRIAALGEGAPFEPANVPRVAYTQPQIAQVGVTPDAAAGREVLIRTLRFEETLLGLLDRVGERADKKGHVHLVCASDGGRVLGGAALGPGAAEIACAVALAMTLGATNADLARAAAAVPSHLDALLRATW